MKRYFDKEDFISFLNLLEEGKYTKLLTESPEDDSIAEFNFLKTKFQDAVIILYNNPYYCGVGVIQDVNTYSWEDIAEGVFEDLECNGECKVFIESA